MDTALKQAEKLKSRVVELEKELEAEKVSRLNHGPVGSKTNSDEQKALKLYNAPNVKELLKIDTAQRKFRHVPNEIRQQVINLKENVDTARAIAVMYFGGKPDKIGNDEKQDRITNLRKELEASHFGKEVMLPQCKAYTTGANPDWLAEVTASAYMSEFELDRRVTGLFRDTTMPSDPYNLPTQDGTTIARKIAENVAMTDASFPTGKIVMDATKLGQFEILPEEMNEDSAPAILPTIRDDVVMAQERAYEQAIINGNAADLVAIPADDARTAWDGLRKIAADNSAFGGTYDFAGTLDDAGMKLMKKQGGKFTTNPQQLAWIASPSAYHQMVGLEVFSTAEKFGNSLFTNLTGVLGAALGIPVIVSEYLFETLDATGIDPAAPDAFTGLLLVNRSRFFMGTRRAIRVRVVQDLPQNDRWLLSSYSRKDFKGRIQSATETSVIYGINIAS